MRSLLRWIPFLMILCCHGVIHPSFKPSYHQPTVATADTHDDDNDETAAAAEGGEGKHVIGIDFGTESVRVGVFSCITGELKASSAHEYKTYFPSPGYAEQDPLDWWTSLCQAMKDTMSNTSASVYESITGLCIDTTACTVVALDNDYNPLRRCLLWMDVRSAKQSAQILELGFNDPALAVNCGGIGPISAEWMLPKALWIKQTEPTVWSNSAVICEMEDYLNYRLTNRLCASSCNVAARWHWNAEEASSPLSSIIDAPTLKHKMDDLLSSVRSDSDEELRKLFPGRPISLLRRIGMLDVLQKWPQQCISMGEQLGGLSQEAAMMLGLPEGLPIIQGGPDAYVGMIGLGCVRPGKLALITGSSHLHLAISSGSDGTSDSCSGSDGAKPVVGSRGIWGPYRGAPVQGLHFAEGGQSSTGSVLSWARRLLSSSLSPQHARSTAGAQSDDLSLFKSMSTMISYSDLNDEAALVPPGSDGLLSLVTFQGARTPKTDPLARGAIAGLTLSHTRGHLWRALQEGVCYGTRSAIDALRLAGLVDDSSGGSCESTPPVSIAVSGGATRSTMFLQMHADVTNMTVVVGTFDNAPMLGAAILAAVGTGQFKSSVSKERRRRRRNSIQTTSFQEQIDEAVACMVHELKRLHPCPISSQEYSRLYSNYMHFTAQVEDLSHALATNTTVDSRSTEESLLIMPSSPSSPLSYALQSGRESIVMPSILAADFGALSAEALLCEDIGAKWIHVDVCDGNTGCPGALTVGPQSVAAIHRSCPQLMQDVHVVSDNIMPLLQPLAAAGAARVTFQYEQVLQMDMPIDDPNSFFDECGVTATSIGIDYKLYYICRHIEELGMQVGVCISPDTSIEVLDGLMMLRKKADKDCLLIDNVDVLAVNPGFGGQVFNEQVLIKLRSIANRYPMLKYLSIDGGVNAETAVKAAEAGANVLIAGSSIFGKNRIISDGRNGPLKSYQQLHTILMQHGL